MPFASFCQHFTGGGKLNSDPEALVGVNLFQAVFHKLSDDRGTEAEEENSCVRPHSYHGMVVTEAYHRIWFGLRELCRWFIKILFMAVMILSQEETYLILIIEVRASMRLWLMLAVRECERDRVCVFLGILVNVFPFKRIVEDMYDLYVQGGDCMGPLHSGCGAPLPGDFRVKLQVLPPSHRNRCCPSHCHWTENCFSQLWAKSQGNIGHYERDRKGAVVFSTPIQISTAFIMYPRSVFVQMLGEGLPKDTFAVALHMQDWMFILRKSQICSWPRYPRFGADRHCHLHHTFAFA